MSVFKQFKLDSSKNYHSGVENLLDSFNLCKEIFIQDCIYISGSTCIKLYNKTLDDEEVDLDLYFGPSVLIGKKNNIACELINKGYYLSSCKIENIDLLTVNEKHNYITKLKSLILKYNSGSNSNIDETNKYFTLKEYLNGIIKLYNPKTKKSIDLMFMNRSIRETLYNVFDFDIVKNYLTMDGKMYIHNIDAINSKIATISLKHFNSRILNNIYEFNNFITRYQKYSNRGYIIYIGKFLITNDMFIILINKIVSTINHLIFDKNKFYMNTYNMMHYDENLIVYYAKLIHINNTNLIFAYKDILKILSKVLNEEISNKYINNILLYLELKNEIINKKYNLNTISNSTDIDNLGINNLSIKGNSLESDIFGIYNELKIKYPEYNIDIRIDKKNN
jgi:hypothetical protein